MIVVQREDGIKRFSAGDMMLRMMRRIKEIAEK
jgi:hypothetical protein